MRTRLAIVSLLALSLLPSLAQAERRNLDFFGTFLDTMKKLEEERKTAEARRAAPPPAARPAATAAPPAALAPWYAKLVAAELRAAGYDQIQSLPTKVQGTQHLADGVRETSVNRLGLAGAPAAVTASLKTYASLREGLARTVASWKAEQNPTVRAALKGAARSVSRQLSSAQTQLRAAGITPRQPPR